ncbi:MAG: acyl-CoA dehydratase activase-related protein, partial [Desulfobacterales bacterium]|nr:acyl-CoA dehydratase activase-related protein [Desulfobacterales bacterium]
VAKLVEKNVDYIFFPDLFTTDHPGSVSRQNYGCAYMQLAFKVMNQTMELDKKGIQLLSPTIAFSMGHGFMKESFSGLGEQLGRTQEETVKALQKGMEAFMAFEDRIEQNSKEVVKDIKSDEKVFVLISKIYGVADPVLNMGIPAKLMEMGYKVIPFYALPDGDSSKEHPNLFWPFSQHILEPAQLIKQHPNLYAILLTHHGCGPDSMVSHYFREEMGGKPYLHIEVDEHSSGVGVITRVEAFINSLKKTGGQEAEPMEVYEERIVHKEVDIKSSVNELKGNTPLYLPYIYPYSQIFKEILLAKGINAKVLPQTSTDSVDIGRKFTITEEYLSATALLGDAFKELYKLRASKSDDVAFFIPQNEGTETDGQYNRFLRTKFDEEGFSNVQIVAPFIEDVLFQKEEVVKSVCYGLLAGDIVQIAHKETRSKHLNDIVDSIKRNQFDLEYLKAKATKVGEELKTFEFKKSVFAAGEFMILLNDYMNNFTFRDREDKGHRVVYSPLSEAIWMMWRDFEAQNNSK